MCDDWYALCVSSKLGEFVPAKTKKGKDYKRYVGLNIHSFRRSAVRNLIRAGVPEKVVMEISGHKTRAMPDRYNITDTTDIVAASVKLEQARARKTDTELTHSVYAQN
jgi:integrase